MKIKQQNNDLQDYKNILLNGCYTRQKKKKSVPLLGFDYQSPMWQATALPTVLPQQSMYMLHHST